MIVVAAVVAKLVDRRISRRGLTPAAATRYRILRRSIFIDDRLRRRPLGAARDPAGARGRRRHPRLVRGARSRARLRRPAHDRQLHRRPPDRVHAAGAARRRGRDRRRRAASSRRSASPTRGCAHRDNDQLVIPNEKLVSETLRNSTIRSPRTLAEVTVHVPLTADLRALARGARARLGRGVRHRPRRGRDDRGADVGARPAARRSRRERPAARRCTTGCASSGSWRSA